MQSNSNNGNNGNTYKWDPLSAGKKLVSGIDLNLTTSTPIVSVGKTFEITPKNDPHKDAYRNCKICGRHYNYHVGGKCPN